MLSHPCLALSLTPSPHRNTPRPTELFTSPRPPFAISQRNLVTSQRNLVTSQRNLVTSHRPRLLLPSRPTSTFLNHRHLIHSYIFRTNWDYLSFLSGVSNPESHTTTIWAIMPFYTFQTMNMSSIMSIVVMSLNNIYLSCVLNFVCEQRTTSMIKILVR